jgi:hypothetical protein
VLSASTSHARSGADLWFGVFQARASCGWNFSAGTEFRVADLQQGATLADFGRGEKRSCRSGNILGASISRGSRDRQRLKPDSFLRRIGTAKAMP